MIIDVENATLMSNEIVLTCGTSSLEPPSCFQCQFPEICKWFSNISCSGYGCWNYFSYIIMLVIQPSFA